MKYLPPITRRVRTTHRADPPDIVQTFQEPGADVRLEFVNTTSARTIKVALPSTRIPVTHYPHHHSRRR